MIIIACQASKRMQKSARRRLEPIPSAQMEVEIHDEAEKAAQSTVFEQHLELAAAAGKGVVIHQRDSWEDTIELLRKYSTRVRAVMQRNLDWTVLFTRAKKPAYRIASR